MVWPYKPTMIDLKKEQDQKTFEGIKKMHEQFVTDEKLREMMHPYNTQCNESLNMRLVELAPKHKNFSRTKSLNYRVSMVVGHHNVGMHQFYRRVFELLNLNLDPALEDWLVSKQKHKERKQVHEKKNRTEKGAKIQTRSKGTERTI